MSPEQVWTRLSEAFPNSKIQVNDMTGGQNHYEVLIESSSFAGQSRLAQHQSVMAAFANELRSGELHALSIKTKLKES